MQAKEVFLKVFYNGILMSVFCKEETLGAPVNLKQKEIYARFSESVILHGITEYPIAFHLAWFCEISS